MQKGDSKKILDSKTIGETTANFLAHRTFIQDSVDDIRGIVKELRDSGIDLLEGGQGEFIKQAVSDVSIFSENVSNTVSACAVFFDGLNSQVNDTLRNKRGEDNAQDAAKLNKGLGRS